MCLFTGHYNVEWFAASIISKIFYNFISVYLVCIFKCQVKCKLISYTSLTSYLVFNKTVSCRRELANIGSLVMSRLRETSDLYNNFREHGFQQEIVSASRKETCMSDVFTLHDTSILSGTWQEQYKMSDIILLLLVERDWKQSNLLLLDGHDRVDIDKFPFSMDVPILSSGTCILTSFCDKSSLCPFNLSVS